MEFIELLKREYGYNEPIFVNEIICIGMSYQSLCQSLKRAADKGLIKRYDKGIYYFPTQTIFGESILDYRRVIEKKYIKSNNDVYGYFCGLTLEHQMGLTTQVPQILEVVTNNESSKKREVIIGDKKIIVKRSRTQIDAHNVRVLQFLELMNSLNIDSVESNEEENIKSYIKQNALTKEDVFEFMSYYPAKALKKIVESGMIYVLA